MGALHLLGATEAVAAFRRRDLSPVELLDAVVARSEEVEPHINAVTERMLDDAQAAARESEARYAGRGGGEPRALEGLPLMLKEEQPIAGRTLEEGSLLEKGVVAPLSHPVVTRVLDAGAVVHARTTTPEFSCAPFTHSALWGITRNPFNLALSPGGSSGGSAAALASGSTTLATGSDIGGSIRLPASLCGLVGFKPPFGRVPGMAPYNQDTYCADGPLGRSVADVALLQNVLAGPHPSDQASLRPGLRLPDSFDDVTGLRVALCVRLGDYPVDPVVEASTRTAAEALRSAGAHVEEITLPWTRELLTTAAWSHFGAIMGAALATIPDDSAELLMPYTRAFITAATNNTLPYVEGLVLEAEIFAPLGAVLESFDVLLCPTFAAQGLTAGDDYTESVIEIDGVGHAWPDLLMTLPFNLIGRVPVLSVPSGKSPNGVPTGVQVVGRTYDDVTVFRVGAALERALGLTTREGWWPDL